VTKSETDLAPNLKRHAPADAPLLMMFLHFLLLLPDVPVGKVKVVGIDDFAWKRGKRYGTVIIDLETHRVLDLLPDQEAESVRQWLLAHPEIETSVEIVEVPLLMEPLKGLHKHNTLRTGGISVKT
jgi:transposase